MPSSLEQRSSIPGIPIASDFAAAYTQFLNDLRKAGRKIDTIAIVNENTEYGTSVAASINEAAKRAGINVGAQIPYNANSTDVSGQVLQLKQLQPDAVIFISYTADTILYFKTLKNLDYLPPIIIGDDAGFSDPAFIPNVGDIAQGAINRSAWDVASPEATPTKSTSCSRPSMAATSTTPARAGCRASSS
jgi:branched-chain amino acid transport system substrate-binding protein